MWTSSHPWPGDVLRRMVRDCPLPTGPQHPDHGRGRGPKVRGRGTCFAAGEIASCLSDGVAVT